MSAPKLTDAQLDALLGQAPSPPTPADGLADRIMARAAATPQRPANRFVPAPRRLRRRPFVLTTIIAANALAAAAAASSWDGQRFDFNRLADLPHRVAAAIHLPHHHRREPERLGRSREAPRVRPAALQAQPRPVVTPLPHKVAIPVTASLGMRNPAASPYRGGHVAVTAIAHARARPERPEGVARTKIAQRIPRDHALARQEVARAPVMKQEPAATPYPARDLGAARPYMQPQAEVRPEVRPETDDNRRFDRARPNNWQRHGPRARFNPRDGAGRPRQWQKWRRNFRPPQRNQGRRFARRF